MNEYPSGWVQRQLGEVCECITKGTTPGEYTKKGVNFVKVESVSPEGELIESKFAHVTSQEHEKLRRSQLQEGDILISIAGTLGRVASISKEHLPANTNQALAIVRLKSGTIDLQYCLHFLASKAVQLHLQSLQTIGAQPNLSLQQVSEIPLAFPPIPEQKKIAEILSGIDKSAGSCAENLSKTAVLRASLLKSMIEGAEEESTECLLGNIVQVINGRAYKLSEWEDEGTPVIRLQNLTQRGGTFYYSNLPLPEKHYCNKGDLLFMWSASFGPHIWWGEKAIFHYHIWKMVPKNESLLKDYLYLFLQYKTDEWRSQGAGMAMVHLTKEGIEKEVIPLPSLEIQMQIVNAIKSIDAYIDSLDGKMSKFSSLKNGMSSDLLSGRKRVSV